MKRKRGPVYATYSCPTCGRGGLAVRGDGEGNTVLHHNACGHIEKVNIPFEDFVERGIAEGQLRELWNPDAKSKEGCFIATAVYGDANALEVLKLRDFRDQVLVRHPAGKIIVRVYYRMSPPFARFLIKHATARTAVRACLDRIVDCLRCR